MRLPALALPLLPVVPLLAPRAAAQDPASIERGLRNLFLERRLAFEDAWAAADGAARARGRELFELRSRSGLPGLYALSALFLTEATARLGGAPLPSERSRAARVAESLDLRVLPAGFSAGELARGEAMIVRVLPAYTAELRGGLPEELELTLVWIGPDGAERRARREPVHRRALALPGFEMYFRSPESEPGRWWLVPEVRLGDETGRGVPVPVDCVANLFPRYDDLRATPVDGPPAALRLELLARALEHGERDARFPSLASLLEVDSPARLAPPAAAQVSGSGAGGDGATFVLEPPPGAASGEVVVVLAPGLEDADWVLVGRGGAAWARLARERGARVLVTSRLVRGGPRPDVVALLDALRAEALAATITVVARGPQASQLRLALAGRAGAPPFDRVVLDTVVLGAGRPKRTFSVPALVFEPLEESAGAEDLEPDFRWVRHTAPPLVAAWDLPGEIAAWWAHLDEAAGDGR